MNMTKMTSSGYAEHRVTAGPRLSSMSMAGMPSSMPMAGMPSSMTMPRTPGGRQLRAPASATRQAATDGWTLPMFTVMAVAMMLPGAVGSVRVVAARSLWRRRGRAMAEWIFAYIGIWVAAGAVILGIRQVAIALGVLKVGTLPMAVGLLVAAGWQLTPAKRRALNGCHRTYPMVPSGLRAERDCLLYGAMIGRECVVSCWPMMAAMTLGNQQQMLLMPVMTAVLVVERFRHRVPRRTTAVALGLFAAIAL
jgi:predicted metal-binding membrane protein